MRFLSPEWIEEVGAAARAGTRPDPAEAELRLVVQQVVTGAPDGEVRYHVVVEGGRVDVRPGDAPPPGPDVTFTQDWSTAVAMSAGELPAQHALVDGGLRVAGDVRALADHQQAFADLDAALGDVRARTTY